MVRRPGYSVAGTSHRKLDQLLARTREYRFVTRVEHQSASSGIRMLAGRVVDG